MRIPLALPLFAPAAVMASAVFGSSAWSDPAPAPRKLDRFDVKPELVKKFLRLGHQKPRPQLVPSPWTLDAARPKASVTGVVQGVGEGWVMLGIELTPEDLAKIPADRTPRRAPGQVPADNTISGSTLHVRYRIASGALEDEIGLSLGRRARLDLGRSISQRHVVVRVVPAL